MLRQLYATCGNVGVYLTYRRIWHVIQIKSDHVQNRMTAKVTRRELKNTKKEEQVEVEQIGKR